MTGCRAEVARISIHSPRMGRDVPEQGPRLRARISIHSPRMGRDQAASRDRAYGADFNPLSPHGERHENSGGVCRLTLFQSTLPAWGETVTITALRANIYISIHSPRMGRDVALVALQKP